MTKNWYASVLTFSQRLLWKLASLIGSLLVLTAICFLLMKLVPGNPFQQQGLSKTTSLALNGSFGTGKPFQLQYITYLQHLVKGDLGISIAHSSAQVTHLFSIYAPASIRLGLQALLIIFPVGIFLGIMSAYRSHGMFDVYVSLLVTLALTLPNFVLAILIRISFPHYEAYSTLTHSLPQHTVLPVIALAILPTAFLIKIIRASTLDILSLDWVCTARMKGLSETRVLFFHVMPHAIRPVLHYFGSIVADLLIGSFVIEKTFQIPGMGFWLVQSIISRDYPSITGLTLFYSCLFLFIYGCIDFLTMRKQTSTQRERSI